MSILEPLRDIFTIYSKSGCSYCTKVELLLEDYIESGFEDVSYVKINCDKYLEDEDSKKKFKEFIKKIATVEVNTFPMVFYDGKFIGGFGETQEYLKCKMIRFDEDF